MSSSSMIQAQNGEFAASSLRLESRLEQVGQKVEVSKMMPFLLNCQSHCQLSTDALHLHADVYLSLNMQLPSSSLHTDVHAGWNI